MDKKKIDTAQLRAFGLIAEEVEMVDPNLVARAARIGALRIHQCNVA
jgi:hypothetical protein